MTRRSGSRLRSRLDVSVARALRRDLLTRGEYAGLNDESLDKALALDKALRRLMSGGLKKWRCTLHERFNLDVLVREHASGIVADACCCACRYVLPNRSRSRRHCVSSTLLTVLEFYDLRGQDNRSVSENLAPACFAYHVGNPVGSEWRLVARTGVWHWRHSTVIGADCAGSVRVTTHGGRVRGVAREPEELVEMRRVLGGQLAAFRQAAGCALSRLAAQRGHPRREGRS